MEKVIFTKLRKKAPFYTIKYNKISYKIYRTSNLNLTSLSIMSLITDFLARFSGDNTLEATVDKSDDQSSHYADKYIDSDVYTSFDVEDIYDEEIEDVVDEEWD
jgi:hypothetical protein